jgi:hypothetical protein
VTNQGEPGAAPRIGIVGAGRSRQGLGPYLAAAFEEAGCRVTAVAGRNAQSALRAAHSLAEQLGHAVDAAADANALAHDVDALVIASPAEAHGEALDAALAAGVPCLCEKPLVPWRQAHQGHARIDVFRARGILLAENCQWPFVLPALFELHPDLKGWPVRRINMGLSPVGAGFSMVEDSLSHVLSVLQALSPVGEDAEVRGVRQSDAGREAEHNVVSFGVGTADGEVAIELHLARCPEPPRPAWIEVNGRRIDRRIGPGYQISFTAPDGGDVKTPDPLRRLVYRVAALLREPHRESIVALTSAADVRLRLYEAVLRHLASG